ncbi:Cupin domain-containing protein [Amycolatopsis marina]|uniref:Cupin domain-containing protein n=1 Tax=Amycolatopsis marina TaxID=490629 RepID=A0A1I0ZS29_9PSEU|nr:cupin domain-containing protein [Amycolatopsis marina]SFB28619.1 Cupin domain-containing protein [Amycolatopsis marina]
MTTTAHYSGPGEGARLPMIDGVHIVKVSAEDTGGVYEVFEVQALRGPAAPPHRSPWAATLYLLEGAVTVQVEGRAFELAAGATISIPAGTANTFEVTSESARFLAFTTGDGAGAFFADFARTVPIDRPFEEIMPLVLAVTERNAVTFAEPAGR